MPADRAVLAVAAAMSCQRGRLRWRASMAATSRHRHFCLIRAFFLIRKHQRIKADIIGPNAQSGRFPAMSAEPTHPTQLGFGIPAHGIKTKTALQRTKPHSLPSWRTRIRHLLRSWETLLVIASRHREEERRSDPFMIDLR